MRKPTAKRGMWWTWSRQHRGKVRHTGRWSAFRHAINVTWFRFRHPTESHSRNIWWVYPCTWTDDYRQGQIGQLHYHVGRRPKR